MKKGLSKSSLGSEKPVRRKRKYDEEFKQQALAMVRNGQSPRSVAKEMNVAPTSCSIRLMPPERGMT